MGSRKPRAIGYVRVSTVEQTHGLGMEVQEEAIRSHCREQGLRLVRIERDEGVSGSNGYDTREGLAAALASLEGREREADVLVVYRLDRLARDLIVQETTIQRLCAADVTVSSVTEPDISADSDDPTRTLVRQVLGAISQYEAAVIRARMRTGKAAKAARGGYVGGRPPFGWKAVGGELVPDEGEQATVARARELRDGGASLRVIAETLTEEGRLPRGVKTDDDAERTRRWHPKTIASILAD